MKLSQLLENEGEPLLTTILRKALARGKQVRVYYKGDGGVVKDIEWDPPAKASRRHASSDFVGNGASSFKLIDDRWVVIGDHNLEKLETTTRVGDGGREIIVAKERPRAPVAEGMMDGRDWINARDAEFKKIISDAGWVLKRQPSYGLENGYFGGTIHATAAAKRSLLNLTEQRQLLMKLLARKFIALAKEGATVIVAPYNVGRSAPSLTVLPHTTVEDIIDSMQDGVVIKLDGSAFDSYWQVSVPKDIVDHVSNEFANALTKKLPDENE